MNEPHDPNVPADIPSAHADSLRSGDPLGTTDHVPGSGSTVDYLPLVPLAVAAPSGDLPAIPGYRVLREIARGGMGRVLAAHDLTLDREVALKILLPGANADRFVRESKITARLPHPGIPPVHALGTLADGSPFLAMKLIAGQTLTVELTTADRPRLLRVFAQIRQVVGFAHSRSVIHRDLKPANVMVGAFDEVQVMDWGLAKEWQIEGCGLHREGEEESSNLQSASANRPAGETQAGTILGTPAYMAPEQARGEACDARADVFSLGAILCAILTGKPPFGGKSMPAVIQRAAAADLAEAFARLDGCGADAELVALCRRCLSPDPVDRPANGQAVADELTAYLDGVQERLQAVERERAVAVVRVSEKQRRRKITLALGAAVLALTTLGGLSTIYYFHQRQERADTDDRQRQERSNAAEQQRQERADAVERVVEPVVALRDQALAKPEDVSRWQAALAAVEQAEASGDATAHDRLLALHTEIQAGLDAAQRNRTARPLYRAMDLDIDGVNFCRNGKRDDGIACFRKAIELDPQLAFAHSHLGKELVYQGQLDEAIAEYRTAIRLKPDYAGAHLGLGGALLALDKLDEASAEFRTAIQLPRNSPETDEGLAHYGLGLALKKVGKLDEAMSELRLAAKSAHPLSPVVKAVPGEIRTLERQIALAPRLPAVLRGEDKPADNAERLAFAQFAYDRKHFAGASRLWAEAFKANPGLANVLKAGHRYNAACAAALAGSAKTADDPPPDEAARSGFRAQARAWLRADLGLHSKQLGGGTAADRGAVVKALQHWKQDSDLAGIRDAAALAKLPAQERAALTQLWADVAELLKKAETSAAKVGKF